MYLMSFLSLIQCKGIPFLHVYDKQEDGLNIAYTHPPPPPVPPRNYQMVNASTYKHVHLIISIARL